MLRALSTSATGMQAQQLIVDTIANNISYGVSEAGLDEVEQAARLAPGLPARRAQGARAWQEPVPGARCSRRHHPPPAPEQSTGA